MLITCKLQGGLGNQMFQYAMGFAVSKKTGASVKFDIREYKCLNPRKYSLYIFDLDIDLIKPGLFISLVSYLLLPFLVLLGKKRFKYIAENFLSHLLVSTKLKNSFRASHLKEIDKPGYYEQTNEEHSTFDPNVFNLREEAYFLGCWESEKYFEDYKDDLRKEFSFKRELSLRSKKLREEILSKNSVSLHIRRGDYVYEPVANSINGVLSIEYYRKAYSYISSKVKDAHIFVFSDDISWARENLDFIPERTFADFGKSSPDYEDMQLMSLCKHNIIANSSFSWWGAWLNNNKEKIVIAPKRFFLHEDRKDVVPKDWIRF